MRAVPDGVKRTGENVAACCATMRDFVRAKFASDAIRSFPKQHEHHEKHHIQRRHH